MRLRVVSWNVHRCIGTDRRYDPERIASILHSLEPDVVTLQEVDSSLRSIGEVDQLNAIANGVGLRPLMGPTMQRGYGVFGNAILYKHPLLGTEEFDLSYRKFEPRGALAATLELDRGRTVRIVNTHLGLKYWERVYQVERLLKDLTWREDPLTILAGDFNEWIPFSPNSSRLNKPFLAVPKLRTFPSLWPRFCLDRVLVSGACERVSHRVIDSREARAASDHLPFVADLYTA
jgi:endonuclease/exonuclease/phosphatase family metal-dependent hydrolase